MRGQMAFFPLIYLKAEIIEPNILLFENRARDGLPLACARLAPGKNSGLLNLSGADFGQAGQSATWLLRLGRPSPNGLLPYGPLRRGPLSCGRLDIQVDTHFNNMELKGV